MIETVRIGPENERSAGDSVMPMVCGKCGGSTRMQGGSCPFCLLRTTLEEVEDRSSLLEEDPSAEAEASQEAPTRSGTDAFGERSSGASQATTPATYPVAPPSTFPPGYAILGELGRGGMGIVYRARHEGLNQVVALKMISAGARAGPQDVERFVSEAQAVARLRHPNIVRIHELGNHAGVPYFTLEYCEGGSLGRLLKVREDAPIDPAEAAALMETVARAVDFAHRSGIVHRDISPGNILLTADSPSGRRREDAPGSLGGWIPKITDFGLAKNLEDGEGRTVTGAVLGTPSYMAPEQAAGRSRHIVPAADIYALGAVFYKLLAGRPPFKGPTAMDTMAQVVRDEPIAPGRLQPNLPRDLETICLKCLHKDPEQRYASAAALAEDLERWRGGRPILARPVGLLGRGWSWCRRNRAVASLSFLAVFLLLAGSVAAGLLALWALGERDRAEENALRYREQKVQADQALARAEAEQAFALRESAKARRNLADTNLLRVGTLFEWAPDAALELLENEEAIAPQERGPAWYFYRDYCRRRVRTLPFRTRILAWRPGGTSLAVVDDQGRLRLWNTASWKEDIRFDGPTPPIVALAWKPDGTVLAAGCEGGTIRFWDASTGRSGRPPLTTGKTIRTLAWDGSNKLIRYLGKDGGIHVWDLALDQATGRRPGPDGNARVFAWRGDGRVLAAVAADSPTSYRVELYDCVAGKRTSPFPTMEYALNALSWNQEGTRIAVVSHDGAARILEASSGKLVRELWSPDSVPLGSLAWSPDGGTLATSGWDRVLHLWDAAAGAERARLKGHAEEVAGMAWSPERGLLATTATNGVTKIWRTDLSQETVSLRGHLSFVHGLAWRPDGQRLGSGSSDRTVKVWDIDARAAAGTLRGHLGPITCLAWNRSGTQVASGSSDGTVRLWDATSGKQMFVFEGHQKRVFALAWSPDDATLASGAEDFHCRLWDLATRKQRAVLRGHPDTVQAISFDPTGKTLATGCGKGWIRLWDVARAAEIAAFRAHAGNVYCLAWNPQKDELVSGGKDQAVKIWDVAARKVRKVLKGHTHEVRAVCWNPDGTMVASGGWDRTIRLWDGVRGRLRAVLRGHEGIVTALAWSPDGKWLASGGDHTVKLWKVGGEGPAVSSSPGR